MGCSVASSPRFLNGLRHVPRHEQPRWHRLFGSGTPPSWTAARREQIASLIRDEPVLLIGMRHMRCTMAAAERLEGASACYRHEGWDDPNEPLWMYMKCLHPNELVGGMEMHSYVYIGGHSLPRERLRAP